MQFPDEFIDPKKKEQADWGLQAARAMWSHFNTYTKGLFYNSRDEYDLLAEYALGEQDKRSYVAKEKVGVSKDNVSLIRGIRWDIRNYMTKRFNIILDRVLGTKYTPTFKAIDPLSKTERELMRGKLKAYDENKQMYDAMTQMIGGGSEMMPNAPRGESQIDNYIDQDFKMRDEIEAEQGVMLSLDRNRYHSHIERLMGIDGIVSGVMACVTTLDDKGFPKIRRAHPSRLIVPFQEDQDWFNLPYWGEVRYLVAADFHKLCISAGKSLVEAQELFKMYAKTNTDDVYGNNIYDDSTFNEMSELRVSIMEFEYKTVNEDVYVEKKDRYGNDRFIQMDYDYYRTDKEQSKFREKYGDTERKLHRKSYDTIMCGTWIVNSDILLNYYPKKYMDRKWDNLGEAHTSLKMYIPNVINNKVHSVMKQVRSTLDEIQGMHIKISHLIAGERPDLISIDLSALAATDIPSRGRMMSDSEKIDMILDSGWSYIMGKP